jgi:hypothetical protein
MKRRSAKLGALSIGVTACIALATFACSSSNSGTRTANASTASNFISSYCSYIGSCCGSQSLPSDGSQCREFLGFEVNSSAYNATQGQACLNAVSSAAGSDPAWCVDQQASTNTACNGAFGKSGGTVQPGGKCTTDSDCAAAPSGDVITCRTYFSNNAQTQICQVETHGKAGDGPCLGTIKTVSGATDTSFNDQPDGGMPSQGVYCFNDDGVACDATTSTCVALGQIGDSSCLANGCVSGAHCDDTTDKCVASAATGSACTQTTDCITGNYCNTSGGNTCTAQLNTNAPCTTSDQCVSGSCSNGKCGAGLAAIGLALLCGGGDGG